MSARTAAAGKLVALTALGVVSFAIHALSILALLLLAVVLLGHLVGLGLRALWRPLRFSLLLAASMVLAHGMMTTWHHGAVVGLRLTVVITAASLLSQTTSVAAMLAVVEGLLRPMKPLGVDPQRVSLVFAMTIRFVPLLVASAHGVREAQLARGVRRPGPTLLGPLLIATLRLGDSLADALDARGVTGHR